MDRIKRKRGWIYKQKYIAIRFRTEGLDSSAIPYAHYDWEESVHVKVENIIPFDAIEPLGKNLVVISCHDANLCHNVINIIHITRVLYFVRKNPAEWYSKKQATV